MIFQYFKHLKVQSFRNQSKYTCDFNTVCLFMNLYVLKPTDIYGHSDNQAVFKLLTYTVPRACCMTTSHILSCHISVNIYYTP